jgi:hypothetical protein
MRPYFLAILLLALPTAFPADEDATLIRAVVNGAIETTAGVDATDDDALITAAMSEAVQEAPVVSLMQASTDAPTKASTKAPTQVR